MNKVKLLLCLALICMGQTLFAAKSVIIKYSVSDCVVCNMQLQSFRSIAKAYNTTVVFRSEYSGQLPDVKELISEMGMKMNFSDSLYYAYDSSERSMIYVFDGNKPVVNEYLKTADVNRVKNALSSGDATEGHIKFATLTALRTSGKYIYMSGSGAACIARVSKENLNEVYDTIRVFSKEIKKEIFKTCYGKTFQDKLTSFDSLSKQYRVPNTFNVSDFQVCGDSLFVLAMTNTIDITDSTHMRVNNLPFIMLMVNKQVKAILPVNYHATVAAGLPGAKLAYHLNPKFFFFNNGSFFISLGKDSLTADNALFAKTTMKSGGLSIAEVSPYNLPPVLVANKVGYMMEDKMYSNGIVSNVYSSVFYNVQKHHAFSLGMGEADGKDFTLADAMNLKLKVKFRVVSFNYNNDRLNVIYKKGDSLLYAAYALTGKEPQKIAEKLLTASFPDSRYSYAITCDDLGFYNYDYKNYRFVRYSY